MKICADGHKSNSECFLIAVFILHTSLFSSTLTPISDQLFSVYENLKRLNFESME